MSVDKTKFRTICFIPTKNCHNTLAEVLGEFSDEILSYIEEILVVDNASTDQTVQVARDSLAKISGTRCTILQNSRNFGLGGSHKIAMNYAYEHGFDYIIVLHGDNSVSIKSLLPILKNHRYLEFDAALASRFHTESRRENYPAHRVIFNIIVNIFASLVTRRWVSDFTGGALNCYRVSSYINKFENPIKRYSNDVAFPQFVSLYAFYRRHRVCYFPVHHRERDIKPREKLVSQFGKAILLVLRFFLAADKTVDNDVFGTFFGHTFRRIKVHDLEVGQPAPLVKEPEVVLSLTREKELPSPAPVSAPVAAPEIVKRVEAPVVTKPAPEKKTDELSLIDLRKLRLTDLYNPAAATDIPELETCDLTDDHHLWLRTKLDVETISSRGLRATFLHLLKIYSPQRIHLEINADRVLRSQQFLNFLSFTNDHGIATGVVSMNPGNIKLWKKYASLTRNLTLNYEYGSNSREDFVSLVNELTGSQAQLAINVLTHHQHFYHCYGLYDQLRLQGAQKSLRLQPYLSPADSEKPKDHLDILESSFEVAESKGPVSREHYQLQSRITVGEAKKLNDGKEFGFTRIVPGNDNRLKILDLDHRGNLFVTGPNETIPLGSLYEGPAKWSVKLTQLS